MKIFDIHKLKYLYFFRDELARKVVRATVDVNIFAQRASKYEDSHRHLLAFHEKGLVEELGTSESENSGLKNQEALLKEYKEEATHNRTMHEKTSESLRELVEAASEIQFLITRLEEELNFIEILLAKWQFYRVTEIK